jgi:D-alanyl-D-alanine carboxypeptidase
MKTFKLLRMMTHPNKVKRYLSAKKQTTENESNVWLSASSLTDGSGHSL